MSMQDPIADMLTRIRNAQAVGAKETSFHASNFKLAILKVLKDEGYIEDFSLLKAEGKKEITVLLKYYQGKPVIEKIKRISCAGLRIYKGANKLPVVRSGMGIAIVSTPKGVMTEKNARKMNVGGEVLCTVE